MHDLTAQPVGKDVSKPVNFVNWLEKWWLPPKVVSIQIELSLFSDHVFIRDHAHRLTSLFRQNLGHWIYPFVGAGT